MGSLAPRIDKIDRNLLINGNFDFWQRGTSITPVGFEYLADRWQNHSGVTTNYSRQIGGPNSVSTYFARVTGPSGLIGIGQRVESNFTRYITTSNLTFSFWVKVTSGTASISVQVRTPATVDNWSGLNTLILNTVVGTATTSWQKFTYFVPVTSNMKSLGFMISPVVAGAVSATTLDTAQCVLLQDEVSDPDFNLAGLNYAEELALCQRYYEKSTDIETSVTIGAEAGLLRVNVGAIQSGIIAAQAYFKVTKRITPTIAHYDLAGTVGVVTSEDAGATRTNGRVLNASGVSTHDLWFRTFSVPSIAGFLCHWVADAEL